MTTNYPGWATKVAAEIATERKTANPASVETMRLAAIRREAARRGASDDTVAYILEGLMVVGDDGEIVERDTGKPMHVFVDDLEKSNPSYFTKRAAADTSTPSGKPILDPKNPKFNATAATLYARSNPEAMAELMANLSPTQVRTF